MNVLNDKGESTIFLSPRWLVILCVSLVFGSSSRKISTLSMHFLSKPFSLIIKLAFIMSKYGQMCYGELPMRSKFCDATYLLFLFFFLIFKNISLILFLFYNEIIYFSFQIMNFLGKECNIFGQSLQVGPNNPVGSLMFSQLNCSNYPTENTKSIRASSQTLFQPDSK